MDADGTRERPWAVTVIAALLAFAGAVAMVGGVVVGAFVALAVNDAGWMASAGFDLLDLAGFLLAGMIVLAGFGALHVARMLLRLERAGLWAILVSAGGLAVFCASALFLYLNDEETRALDAQFGGTLESVLPPAIGLALGVAICAALGRPSVRSAFS